MNLAVGVLGAGSIGCYLGGRLAAAGAAVTLVGRPALKDEIARFGLRLTDCDGGDCRVPPERLTVATEAAALATAAVILVTVKSQDTEAAAHELAALPARATPRVVVSFQNGVRNAALLSRLLPAAHVVGGMVPYNVLRQPQGRFHRGTSGALVVERRPDGAEAALAAALTEAGLACERRADLAGIQWGKLLFNINNSINALAGIPLRRQLGDRGYRLVMAAVLGEAVTVLKAGKVHAVPPIKVPPWVMPHVLRLPDALFLRLASTMVKVDPEARSSMWEDLDRRRRTEVDFLNGEIVALAESVGMKAPVNARVVEMVRAAEREKRGSPCLSPAELLAGLAGRWADGVSHSP